MATLLLTLGNLLACAGCASKWSPFAKKTQTPGLTTPSEYVAELREIGDRVHRAKPEEQEEIAQQLTQGLKTERDPFLRMEVLRVLGKTPSPTAIDMLEKGLQDPDSDVRAVCCEAWREQGGKKAVELLSATVVNDTDPDVRLTAARCLGPLKDRAAVPVLGQLLEEQNPAMQYQAVLALQEITGQDLGNDVNAWVDYVKQGAPDRPISWASRMRNVLR